MMEIRIYTAATGQSPFTEWLEGLDMTIGLRMRKRIERLTLGNFGDYKSVGDGVFELRMHFGAGYRVYYAKDEEAIVLLLNGGDKSSQKKDIENAKKYWKDYAKRTRKALH